MFLQFKPIFKRREKDKIFKFKRIRIYRSSEVAGNNAEYGKRRFSSSFALFICPKKGLNLEKRNVNDYSYDKGVLVRYFSDFEILIQKIWYLLITGKKVKYDEIESLLQGYSCIADLAKDGYHEVFKYAIKNNIKRGQMFDYETFKIFENLLYKRRTIQGYGCLYGNDMSDEELLENEADDIYTEIINELLKEEEPEMLVESFNRVMQNIVSEAETKYISRKSIRQYILEAKKERDEESKAKKDRKLSERADI